MDYFSGKILTKNGFQNEYLGIKNHIIIEKGKGKPPKKEKCKGLIIPKFINSHTHIGDSFIRKKKINLPRKVEDLVAPPNGLKHRLLKKTSDNEIISGMEESIKIMKKMGTISFCDFRENGLKGINQIKNALNFLNINAIILSRPEELSFNKKEIDNLLNNSNGIGLSSITDWEYSEIEKISKLTKKRKKIFAIHASERIRENIDQILDLKPNILIHMNYATESDLKIVKDNKIPIIICPRSNDYFGLKSNFKLMNKLKINILLGTDNAMLNKPDILEEVKYFKNLNNSLSIENILNMVTYNPRKALNLDYSILDLSSSDEFVVLDDKSLRAKYISNIKNGDKK